MTIQNRFGSEPNSGAENARLNLQRFLRGGSGSGIVSDAPINLGETIETADSVKEQLEADLGQAALEVGEPGGLSSQDFEAYKKDIQSRLDLINQVIGLVDRGTGAMSDAQVQPLLRNLLIGEAPGSNVNLGTEIERQQAPHQVQQWIANNSPRRFPQPPSPLPPVGPPFHHLPSPLPPVRPPFPRFPSPLPPVGLPGGPIGTMAPVDPTVAAARKRLAQELRNREARAGQPGGPTPAELQADRFNYEAELGVLEQANVLLTGQYGAQGPETAPRFEPTNLSPELARDLRADVERFSTGGESLADLQSQVVEVRLRHEVDAGLMGTRVPPSQQDVIAAVQVARTASAGLAALNADLAQKASQVGQPGGMTSQEFAAYAQSTERKENDLNRAINLLGSGNIPTAAAKQLQSILTSNSPGVQADLENWIQRNSPPEQLPRFFEPLPE